MRSRNSILSSALLIGVFVLGAWQFRAEGQTVPWGSFQDPATGTICDTVNAENAQFVVLADTSELVVISGIDRPLSDLVMDEQGDVTFGGDPAGTIAFATDGDGNARVFWMTLTGSVVHFDSLSSQPSDSDKQPNSLHGVRCDACSLWDDQSVCPTTNPPPTTPPPTTVHVCGQDVPVTIGMIALLLIPLRVFGPGRRGLSRQRNPEANLADLP